MEITAEIAADHIVTSMQNDNSDIWFDEDDNEWMVRNRGNGVITIDIEDQDGLVSTNRFRLVKIEE